VEEKEEEKRSSHSVLVGHGELALGVTISRERRGRIVGLCPRCCIVERDKGRVAHRKVHHALSTAVAVDAFRRIAQGEPHQRVDQRSLLSCTSGLGPERTCVGSDGARSGASRFGTGAVGFASNGGCSGNSLGGE